MVALGLGVTHYPMLAATDQDMANPLRWTLRDPDIPDSAKDPAGWPARMQREWGSDDGVAACAAHRSALRADLLRCRQALDEFRPDLVVVWGDDQYENFREEVVPPFCVLAYADQEIEAFEYLNMLGLPNAWGFDPHRTLTMHGNPPLARDLANHLIGSSFDVAYSYKKRDDSRFPHSILNTQIFLDYDEAGATFPYPIVPVTVNCYGQHAIVRRGGLARFADIWGEQVDPIGPSPHRCFELGRSIARFFEGTDLRVAYVASSSWSHAFLNDKDWHIFPDTGADEALYKLLVAGYMEQFSRPTVAEVVDAGQHEMLNWFCLAGAVHELDLPLEWSSFRASDVCNSNKVFAVFS